MDDKPRLTVLVDGDIVAYRCAASCLKQGQLVESEDVALFRINDLMHRIIEECEATHYRTYIGGIDNFRHTLYPDYKANRKESSKPPYLELCRQHLVTEWGARVVNGMETDDQLGIEQCRVFSNPLANGGESTIIASIDKDLLMIPGRHYNFVKSEFYEVSEMDGIRHFWFQMIMGDKVDNIPGYDGVSRIKVPKFLQPQIDALYEMNEEEMEQHVKDMYHASDNQAQFEINKKLIYILRESPPEELGAVDGGTV